MEQEVISHSNNSHAIILWAHLAWQISYRMQGLLLVVGGFCSLLSSWHVLVLWRLASREEVFRSASAGFLCPLTEVYCVFCNKASPSISYHPGGKTKPMAMACVVSRDSWASNNLHWGISRHCVFHWITWSAVWGTLVQTPFKKLYFYT